MSKIAEEGGLSIMIVLLPSTAVQGPSRTVRKRVGQRGEMSAPAVHVDVHRALIGRAYSSGSCCTTVNHGTEGTLYL